VVTCKVLVRLKSSWYGSCISKSRAKSGGRETSSDFKWRGGCCICICGMCVILRDYLPKYLV